MVLVLEAAPPLCNKIQYSATLCIEPKADGQLHPWTMEMSVNMQKMTETCKKKMRTNTSKKKRWETNTQFLHVRQSLAPETYSNHQQALSSDVVPIKTPNIIGLLSDLQEFSVMITPGKDA